MPPRSKAQSVLQYLNIARNGLSARQFKFGSLFLTTRCNILCAYCWIPTRRQSELSATEWRPIINKLRSGGVFHFNLLGGEPLLRTDLEDLVSYIASTNSIACITTNGYLLDSSRLRSLRDSGLFTLVISLDRTSGPIKGDPESAFSWLTEAKSYGILPVVHCVISSQNVAEVPELATRAVEHGILFSCSVYQRIGGIQSRPVDKLVPSEADVVRAFNHIEHLKKTTGLVRTSYAYMRDYSTQLQHGWHCDPAKSNWVTVQSDGTLMACTEHKTTANIVDIEGLDSREFFDVRREATEQCGGCYYECYYTEEALVGGGLSHLVPEIPLSLRLWGLFGHQLLRRLF